MSFRLGGQFSLSFHSSRRDLPWNDPAESRYLLLSCGDGDPWTSLGHEGGPAQCGPSWGRHLCHRCWLGPRSLLLGCVVRGDPCYFYFWRSDAEQIASIGDRVILPFFISFGILLYQFSRRSSFQSFSWRYDCRLSGSCQPSSSLTNTMSLLEASCASCIRKGWSSRVDPLRKASRGLTEIVHGEQAWITWHLCHLSCPRDL